MRMLLINLAIISHLIPVISFESTTSLLRKLLKERFLASSRVH